eukprot:2939447-Rhodomonas_salina.2
MGMITYIPNSELPFGTTLILTNFAYKCKFGELGEVIKKKALLCVRGDLQKDCEFTETFAPTSRFNTLRALISVAVQEKLKLVQFDINLKGAFMVSPIDEKDIYISLPDCYKVPEGFTAKLSNSLYGTRNAAYMFWSTLSKWMIEYGFEPVNADKTLFRLARSDGTVVIIALYVDDGLVAHNSNTEYEKFVQALAKRFELSTESKEETWYLGVGIQCKWTDGTLKLTQEQYVNDHDRLQPSVDTYGGGPETLISRLP